MHHLKAGGYLLLAALAALPCLQVVAICTLQVQAWVWVCEVFRPSPWIFVVSAAYGPVLMALTAWYWLWRGLRWIFRDEGPLPTFRAVLAILWLPITLVPTVLIACAAACVLCMVGAWKEVNSVPG